MYFLIQGKNPQAGELAEKSVLIHYFSCFLFACLDDPYLCYDSALVNENGCKVSMLGTQGISP